jgi:hypothetical protein
VIIFALAQPAQAYIGPGAGFAAAGSLLVMFLTMLSAISAFFTWPVRWVIRLIRGWHAFAKSRVKRVVILGLDGLDPDLTEKYISEGRLPNLARLALTGCFKKLAR